MARRFMVPAMLVLLTGVTISVAFARGGIPFTSDQAMVGLMARDILHLGQHPVFYQGSAYGGTLEPHYVAAFFAVLPESVGTYRLAMSLLVVGIVLLIWTATREAFGERAALVSGLALAVGPPFFFYKGLTSDGAYDAVMLLGAGIVLFLFRAERRAAEGRPVTAELAAVGVLGGLAWWVHPVCVVYALPAIALLVFGRLRSALTWRTATLTLAGFLAGGLPWWAMNLGSDWISLRTPVLTPAGGEDLAARIARVFTHSIPILLGGRYPNANADRLALPAAPLIDCLLLGALLVLSIRVLRSNDSPRRGEVIGLLSLVVAPFLMSLSMRRTDFTEPRYMLPFYVGAAPLVGLVVSRMGRPALAGVLLVPLSVVAHARMPRLEDLELGFPSSRERLVSALLERKVATVYSSYWTAYRLTFLSGGRILSTPYGRLGFTTRPADKAAVDAAHAPAFLLGEGPIEEFEAERLEAFLGSIGAPFVKERVEGLHLFRGLPDPVVQTLRLHMWLPVAATPGGVSWETQPEPIEMTSGETRTLHVALRNEGRFAWTPKVHVGYRWRDLAGRFVAWDTPRGFFGLVDRGNGERGPRPGERAAVDLRIEAKLPPGRYRLVVDVVDEHVAWWSDRGVAPLVFDVTVRDRRPS